MRDLRCRDFNEVLLSEEEKRGGDLFEIYNPFFSLNACGADDFLMFQSSSSSSSSSSLFLEAFKLSKKKKKKKEKKRDAETLRDEREVETLRNEFVG